MEAMVALEDFYAGKRVFVTGHTGFKGTWLSEWLLSMGCHVSGYALAPDNDRPSLFALSGVGNAMESTIGDVRDACALKDALTRARPDIVFHLAAQSLVLPSYERPLETLSTNIMGTAQLLDIVRRSGCVRAVVNVTTDKCYENAETSIPLHESNALGGHDPYSASKAAAEIISAAYRDSFLKNAGIAMATARAGNVIGGGDFADHRLIPDMVRAIEQSTPLLLRQPHSIRPWQHVLDVLHGYLLLGQALFEEGEPFNGAYNFAPDDAGITAADICQLFQDALGIRIDVALGDGSGAREAKTLRLNADKAQKQLGWRPAMNTAQAVVQTALWYREYLKQPDMLDAFTASQLTLFSRRVHDRFMVTK